MAGNDHQMDTKGYIENFIEQKIRNLLEYDMNEYQDPAWVQAAELFNEVVVPCDIYISNGLIKLGMDLIEEAERHGCRTIYQQIPGMYNVKNISEDKVSNAKVDIFDYSDIINSIKRWTVEKKEFHDN
ncbi:MAG: hypothetical protein ACTSYF_16430, partial [Promethearchaeota archaeon]